MTPAVSRNLGRWPSPCSVDHAAEKVAQALDAMGRGEAVVDVLTLDGAVAGWIDGFLRPGTGRASIGYWLGELRDAACCAPLRRAGWTRCADG